MNARHYASIKARIETLYDVSGRGEWAKAEALMTDDFRIVEAQSLPFGGVYEGKDALRRLYTKVFGFWDNASIEFEDMTISPDNVVALLSIHATSRHNGERLVMRLCEVIHLRGDKISGITPYYFDTAAIAKAAGALTLA